MRETNRDNKEEKVMKIAVIGGAGVRTVIFINGLLKRYKKLHIDEINYFQSWGRVEWLREGF